MSIHKLGSEKKKKVSDYETNDESRHTLLHKQLESMGVEHDYYIGGFSAHDFMTWRHLLYFRFLPNLWK